MNEFYKHKTEQKKSYIEESYGMFHLNKFKLRKANLLC